MNLVEFLFSCHILSSSQRVDFKGDSRPAGTHRLLLPSPNCQSKWAQKINSSTVKGAEQHRVQTGKAGTGLMASKEIGTMNEHLWNSEEEIGEPVVLGKSCPASPEYICPNARVLQTGVGGICLS